MRELRELRQRYANFNGSDKNEAMICEILDILLGQDYIPVGTLRGSMDILKKGNTSIILGHDRGRNVLLIQYINRSINIARAI